MAFSKTLILAVAAAVLVSGCLFYGDAKWPTLQMPAQKAGSAPASPSKPATAPAPSTTKISTEDAARTFDSLAARLDLHENDATSVQALIADQRGRYESAAEAAGTGVPPSDNTATDTWNDAQVELTRLAAQVERLTDLQETLEADAGRQAELFAAERAPESGGAAAPLSTKITELIARTGTLLDQVRKNRADGERYVAAQRQRLAALRPQAPQAKAPALPKDREAYVVFHMDRDETGSEAALRDAVKQALDRKPDMTFDLYTVTGDTADDLKAQDRADDIERIIRSMSVAEDHITITNIRLPDATPPEVRIYIR